MKDKHFYFMMAVLIVLTLIDIFIKIRVIITQPIVVRQCAGITMEEINQGIRSGALEVVQ